MSGAVVFMLLGALIGGSDWGQSTIKTALLQGPSRLRTYTGQALAVAIAAAVSVALTFALAAAASAAVALRQAGSLDPAGSPFPAFGHLAAALAAALGCAGLRRRRPDPRDLAAQRHRGHSRGTAVGRRPPAVDRELRPPAARRRPPALRHPPDAATNTVVNLAGSPSLNSSSYSVAQIAPALAFLTFGLYAAAFVTIPP